MAGSEKLPIAGMPTVEIPAELTTFEQVKAFIHQTVTRRDFNKAMGVAGLGAVAFQMGCASEAKQNTDNQRQVYVANANFMIVADPGQCVGCRRCEMACSGYNENRAQPSISNIKVNRNLLYGTENVAGGLRGAGIYGNFRVVQDTCRQCAHPVPCQLACPQGAIEAIGGTTNARVVNEDKCVGCGICVEACPWEMTALDGPVLEPGTKCHKCHLCSAALAAGQERPNCVEACPAGALKFVAWNDRTNDVPARHVVPGGIELAPAVKDTCKQCH
jgi:Fe-S-cluster-containing dehydrogenase component